MPLARSQAAAVPIAPDTEQSAVTLLGTWGSHRAGNGQSTVPRGIAVDPDGMVDLVGSDNAHIPRLALPRAFTP